MANSASTSVTSDTTYYGTDNTAAIQQAINDDSAHYNGSAEIIFPLGGVGVAGPLITSYGGVNPNCQIHIPLAQFGNQSINQRTHYVFRGEGPPNFLNMLFSDSVAPISGSWIYTFIDGSGNLPAVFGSKSNYSSTPTGANFNYATFKNLEIIVPQNIGNGGASIGGINGYYLASLITENFIVAVDGSIGRSVKPTNEVAGIIYSQSESEIQSRAVNTQVENFKYGIIASDDATLETPTVFLCQYAIVPSVSVENIQINHAKLYWNNNDIYVPNGTIGGYISAGTVYFNITNLVTEVFISSGHWYDYSYIVNDAGSKGVADINYTVIHAGGTFDNAAFNVNGGTNIHSHAIGSTPPSSTLDAVLTTGNTSAQREILTGYNTTNTNFQAGDFGVQDYAINTLSLYDNAHYNGSGFVYNNNGYADRLLYYNGAVSAQVAASGSAGGAVTFYTPFVVGNDNSVAMGGILQPHSLMRQLHWLLDLLI